MKETESIVRLDFSTINECAKNLESNLKVFRYNNIAFHHRGVAQEIIRKRHFSEDNYMQILQNTFPNAHLSIEEAYKYAYGNFYDEKDFAKRPLAKLTKDIAINVGAIHTLNEDNI